MRALSSIVGCAKSVSKIVLRGAIRSMDSIEVVSGVRVCTCVHSIVTPWSNELDRTIEHTAASAGGRVLVMPFRI